MKQHSLFFYDLETSGISPRASRIMQFAGQRTDMELNPQGEAVNCLIKLSEDILPEPHAVLVTGITPQKTIAEGITEAEFIKLFDQEINYPNTIFVGFNNIRFDDEFMRFLMYRNFYDPYAWQWQEGRSRWDLLDVVRMTRALRPSGVKWPTSSDGKPTNRLELLTALNSLTHSDAHDALSDVKATIAVARLIQKNQPKLFSYLRGMRDKNQIKQLVETSEMFVYVSGKYASESEKLAVVCRIGEHPNSSASLVYDLRHNPSRYISMTPKELADAWKYKKDSEEPRLPVKTLKYNRCPAVAPLSVLTAADAKRLRIDLDQHNQHKKMIDNEPTFYPNICKALALMEKDRVDQTELLENPQEVEEKLYDGFFGDDDRKKVTRLRKSEPSKLDKEHFLFQDTRLNALLPLYKARNYPKSLSDAERKDWEAHCQLRIAKQLPKFSETLESILSDPAQSKANQYLLEELRLYAQSILH